MVSGGISRTAIPQLTGLSGAPGDAKRGDLAGHGSLPAGLPRRRLRRLPSGRGLERGAALIQRRVDVHTHR